MKVAISGSSGFIGRYLSKFLMGENIVVVPIPHTLFQEKACEELKKVLSGCNAVVNLAGISIHRYWSERNKQRILDSRISATHYLVKAINEMLSKPEVFISASAVGIYPSEGIYSEKSIASDRTFLADVCTRWEDEAQKVSADVRLVIARLGVVLASDGGALPKILLPFRFFLGGRIASGKQGFSWIHIDDVVHAILFLIQNTSVMGVVNLTSPQPINNRVLTEAIEFVLHRPAWLNIPTFVFRFLYGEGACLVTEGQQAYPACLLLSGYAFRYPDIRIALQSLQH